MPAPKRLFRFPWRSRDAIAADVDAELAFHLDERVADLVRQGAAPEEARRQAQDEFGDIEYTRKYCRDMDTTTERELRMADRLAAWSQDLRYAWRTLWRSPGFTVVALLTLALAIGANTAIFSVARAVLLRPLAYGQPERLVGVFTYPLERPTSRYDLSAPDLVDYRASQRSFTDIAVYSWQTPTTWRPVQGDPEIVRARAVSPNMFPLLQVPALLGRGLADGDELPSAPKTVVISWGFWQRVFGGDPGVLEKNLVLSDQPYRIVGVMPRGFSVRDQEDMWLPLDISDDLANPSVTRKQHVYGALARLKDGVTIEAARGDVMAIAKRLQQEYPASNGNTLAVVDPLQEARTGRLREPILLLLAAASAVLLIACANLANLTLSRTVNRQTEIAVRAALGAGRGRIARQLLTESLVLAIGGGALGLLLAVVGVRGLLALNPEALPRTIEVGMDLQALLFSALLSLATGVLFGLLPALSAGRADLQSSLKSQSRGGTLRGSDRARRGLVVAQVALAVILLVGAGLLTRSFRDLNRLELGFIPEKLLTAQLRVDGARYDSAPAVNRFFDDVIERLQQTPGIEMVGASMAAPMQGLMNSGVVVEGIEADGNKIQDIGYNLVRGDYFKTLGLPIVAGRGFDASDIVPGAHTGMVNQAAVKAYFGGTDPVGRRIRIGPNPQAPWITVIGVVGDMRDESLDTPARPRFYDVGARNTWWRSFTVMVRTRGDASTAMPAIREAVRAADPTLAVRNIATQEEIIGDSLAARRFSLGLAAAFAALALVLAAVGIYGVLAYSVSARTREFGVRLALGASPRSVLRMVLSEGLSWSLLGLAIGVAAALAGGKVISGMLYGVTATDTTTYVSVAIGLVIVVVLACLVPAFRATRVDPLASMRAE
jgi:predicted permease